MSNLNTTAGIVALGAGVVALLALISCCWLALSLRRLRSAQQAVLGENNQDLVAHAATLQASFETLAQYVEDVGTRLEERVNHAEGRLDGTLAHTAVVRYDAYGEMSGQQSASVALLDATRSGVVLSSINHRDSARLYMKQVHSGSPEFPLSPEESEAMRLALGLPASIKFDSPRQ